MDQEERPYRRYAVVPFCLVASFAVIDEPFYVVL